MTPLAIFFFFFNDTATTEIYTLSLHDALPISTSASSTYPLARVQTFPTAPTRWRPPWKSRSEEHTSELQSQSNLVCRLLLEKKKKRYERVEPRFARRPARISDSTHGRTYAGLR